MHKRAVDMHRMTRALALRRLTQTIKHPEPAMPVTVTIIPPSVGQSVMYHPGFHEYTLRSADNQPCAATIAYVHSDTCVNLGVLDWKGRAVSRERVRLKQDDGPEEDNATSAYATWPPGK
jgi:hypothetical protein